MLALKRIDEFGGYHSPDVCYETMTIISAVVAVAGTVLSVAGQAQAARAQEQALQYQSQVAQQEGKMQQAAASYAGEQERRRSLLAIERTQALAAASGAGATDPTVLNNEGKIAGQGEYNSLMRMAAGKNAANMDFAQASLDNYQASQTSKAARIGMFGTILKGGSSFFSQYGADLFPSGGATGGGVSPYGGMSGPDSISAQLGH